MTTRERHRTCDTETDCEHLTTVYLLFVLSNVNECLSVL